MPMKKGTKLSKEHRDAISRGRKGMKFSDLHREAISKAAQHPLLESTKEALSAALLGKKKSAATKTNMSIAAKESWANADPLHIRCRNIYRTLAWCRQRPKSSGEKRMKLLLDACGVKYREQEPIAGYVVDFFIPDLLSAIEVDGDYWHSHPFAKKKQTIGRDQERDANIREHGVLVYRFLESELYEPNALNEVRSIVCQ